MIEEIDRKSKVVRIPRADVKPPIDDDLRRLCISMLTVLKRRYPNDWRRMVSEMEHKAA